MGHAAKAVFVTVFGMCTTVHASPASDDAFARGREALQVGKYVEACGAFEESQRLEPQPTTQFNIALCDEQLGKLASALAIYRELAVKDDNPARKAKAPEKVAELEGRVARLHLDVDPKAAAGLDVTVNGARVTNIKDVPIDLGQSRVVARAQGFAEWTGQVTAKDEKQNVVLTVRLVPDHAITPPPPPPRRATPSPSPRKTLGLVGMISGGAVLAGGITFGVLARMKWNDAQDVCAGKVCDSPEDLARGNSLVDEARTRGNVSTVLVIAGGALVAGGIVLWVTAPKSERSVALAPAAGPSSAGVSLLGRF